MEGSLEERLRSIEARLEAKPAPDTRSWVKRHSIVIDAALALAAAIVGFGGFLALRRRA